MAAIAGWRFENIDFALAGGEIEDQSALTPMGPVVTAAGGVRMIEGDAAIRQAIILLLSTLPGERVMRPDYGCPLHRLVFNPNDATTAGLGIHYVRQALLRWEPRIDILRLDAGTLPDLSSAADADDGAHLYIRLDYRVRATQRPDRVVVSVALEG
jgi:phage baseplate assembly protein W